MTAKPTTASISPYETWVLDHLRDFCHLDGAAVLEMGGVPSRRGIAEGLVAAGADEVVQLNGRQDLPESVDGAIRYLPIPSGGVGALFPESDHKFDYIFSTALPEQPTAIKRCLETMHELLKPEGRVCLHSSAFWNCHWGHRLRVQTETENYSFNGNNPIANWSHLYLDRQEMLDQLVENGVVREHAEQIVSWVYESEKISRLTYDDFVRIFSSSRFEIVALMPKKWQTPDADLQAKLVALHGNRIANYAIGEALVLLSKPPQVVSPSTETAQEEDSSAPLVAQAVPPILGGGDVVSALEGCYQHLAGVDNHRHDQTLQSLFQLLLAPGDTAIDVGAHTGQHTFALAQCVGPKGRVYAFEPLPHLHSELQQRIAEQQLQDNIRLFPWALSNAPGTAEFLHVEDAPGLSGFLERSSHEGHEINKLQVEVHRLDDVVAVDDCVRFIKIDAEGADFHILQGAPRILSEQRPVVVFESGRINAYPAKSYNYSEREFMEFFHASGYVLYDIAGLKYDSAFWNLPTLNDFVAFPVEDEGRYRQLLQVAVLREFAGPT